MKISKLLSGVVCLATLNGCVRYTATVSPRVESTPKVAVTTSKTVVNVGVGITAGLTVVAIGTAVAAEVVATNNVNDWNVHGCTTSNYYCVAHRQALNKTRVYLASTAFISALSAGVAGTATGVYITVTQNQNTSRRILVVPTANGFSLTGSF